MKIMDESKENIESLKKTIKDVKVYFYLESARKCSEIMVRQYACRSILKLYFCSNILKQKRIYVFVTM